MAIGLSGKSVKMAFAKYGANSWNVAASVTLGAYFTNDGGLKLQPKMVEDDAFGQSFRGAAEVGDYEPPDISLPANARYDDKLFMFDALAMGSPAITQLTSATGQVTSFKHVFDLADVIDGLGITVAQDKVYYTEELTSAKVYGWEEADGDNGRIITTYKLIGTRPISTSSVNINSTVAGAVFPAQTNRIFKKHATFRINAQVGTSLVAASAIQYETLRFNWARVLDKAIVSGQDTIVEPADNGYPEFTLEVTFPRANTTTLNSFRVGMENNVAYKADLTYVGAYINSTDKYTKMYEFPNLRIIDFAAPIEGATQVKPKVTFGAYTAATTPTNMTVLTPFRLTRYTSAVNSTVAF